MVKVKLVRVEKSEEGVFGVLLISGEAFCVTLEPKDLGNKREISCIPEGVFDCIPFQSPKHGNTWEVVNVPNREYILFHAGNVSWHSKGCILLGQYFGKLRGERGILNSGKTFQAFLKRLEGLDHFRLHVESVI